MITIQRVLTYEFPDAATAIKHLNHRGVLGYKNLFETRISEKFYYNSQDAIDVLNNVLTPCINGVAPINEKGE